MVASKMVTSFKADLRKLTSDLDASLSGLTLCIAFQKRQPVNPDGWNLCVSARGLDHLGDRDAIAFILDKLEKDCAPETYRAVGRILILRSTDPALRDLLSHIESEEDASLLIGRTVFGTVIGRVQVFLLRAAERIEAPPMNAVA